MNSMIPHIEFFIGGFVGLIVWAIRLEGKVQFTEQKVEKLFHLEEKISDIRESLARIEGELRLRKDKAIN